MKWGLKGGISIYADSGPPRYVLWCCSGICQQVLTFFKLAVAILCVSFFCAFIYHVVTYAAAVHIEIVITARVAKSLTSQKYISGVYRVIILYSDLILGSIFKKKQK